MDNLGRKRRASSAPVFALVSLLSLACSCLPDPVAWVPVDLRAPELVSCGATSATTIGLEFDEEVVADVESFCVGAGGESLVPRVEVSGGVVTLSLEEALPPGARCVVSGRVQDGFGNSSLVEAEIRGWNDRVPAFVINELLTEKSSKHRDFVELRILSDGNLGGVVLYGGAEGSHEWRYVFPGAEVVAGEYVVLHLLPDGDEVDETDPRVVSAGLDATGRGRDFWWKDDGGAGKASLPDSTGVVSAYERPGGRLVDAIVYCGVPGTAFGGFGRKPVWLAACEMVAAGGWKAAGPEPAPADAVPGDAATATRSLSRASSGADTDSRSDWHVTPTNGLSPGGPNTDSVYLPKAGK